MGVNNTWGKGEGRSQLTNLNQESIKAERVIAEHHTTSVAHDLQDAARDHARTEGPHAVIDALEGVDEQGDGEEGDEQRLGDDGGLVAKDTGLETAKLDGAVGQGAEGDEPVG